MNTRTTIIILIVVVIVIAITIVSTRTSSPIGENLPQVYSNSAMGFSLHLPSGYTVNESYRYQEFGPGKDISGIKFTIPATMATGTNLGSDSYMSIEEIPKIQDCTAALF